MSMNGIGRNVTRIALLFLVGTRFVVRFWALILPQSFYDAFPGFGRVWISRSDPYNEHRVRDVGMLNVALGLLAVIALMRPKKISFWAVGVATLAYNLPHLLYHLATLEYTRSPTRWRTWWHLAPLSSPPSS